MKIISPITRLAKATVFAICLLTLGGQSAMAQKKARVNPETGSKQPAPAPQGLEQPEAIPEVEDDFYKLISLPIPEGVILEVGGLATLPDGSIAACTRRGKYGSSLTPMYPATPNLVISALPTGCMSRSGWLTRTATFT